MPALKLVLEKLSNAQDIESCSDDEKVQVENQQAKQKPR